MAHHLLRILLSFPNPLAAIIKFVNSGLRIPCASTVPWPVLRTSDKQERSSPHEEPARVRDTALESR